MARPRTIPADDERVAVRLAALKYADSAMQASADFLQGVADGLAVDIAEALLHGDDADALTPRYDRFRQMERRVRDGRGVLRQEWKPETD